MPAIVAQFQALNPGVVVELILSNQSLSLSRRDADIAIRLTNDPPETLVGRRICTGRWGIYCRRDVAAALGAGPIDSVAFIGFGGGFGPASGRRWIEANVRPGRLAAKVNSVYCMLELALQGLGAALLPCFLGDRSPDLARIGSPVAGTRRGALDADPLRSSPIGARARLHGFRWGRAREASPRYRGRGSRRDGLSTGKLSPFNRRTAFRRCSRTPRAAPFW